LLYSYLPQASGALHANEKGRGTIAEAGNEIVVVVDGLKIAKRGRTGTPHVKTWVLLEPGWTVRGLWEAGEYAIEIEHNGVRIH